MSGLHGVAGMLMLGAGTLLVTAAAVAVILDRWHEGVRILAGVTVGAFVLQVIIGLVVLVAGGSPMDGLHLLYGAGLVAVIPIALSFASDAPRRARSGAILAAGLVALLLVWLLLGSGG